VYRVGQLAAVNKNDWEREKRRTAQMVWAGFPGTLRARFISGKEGVVDVAEMGSECGLNSVRECGGLISF